MSATPLYRSIDGSYEISFYSGNPVLGLYTADQKAVEYTVASSSLAEVSSYIRAGDIPVLQDKTIVWVQSPGNTSSTSGLSTGASPSLSGSSPNGALTTYNEFYGHPFESSATFQKFSLILQDQQTNTSMKKIGVRCAKLAAAVVSFTSQYPSMEAAGRVSDNVILKYLFCTGEVVAWGSLYSTICAGVIDNILIDRELRLLDSNSGFFCSSIYWLSIAALSFCVQIPEIYISYVYTNGNLFWPIYIGGVYTTFTLDSLNRAIEKSARTDNVLTRFLYRKTKKCRVFRAKENFCILLQEYFTDYLREASSEQKQMFFDMLREEVGDNQHAKTFLFMLAKGLEKKAQKLQTENVYLRRSGKFVKISGALLYIANYYLYGKISYNASKLILDNDYFAAFLIFISTTPNIYLNLDMSTSTLDKVFWGTTNHASNLIKGRWKEYFTRESILRGIGNVFAGFMTCFGLGSTVTVIDDTFGFEDNKIISIAMLVFTALVVANGISSLSDRAIDHFIFLLSNAEEKKLAIKIGQINILIQKMRLMTAEQFQSFTTDIEKILNYEPSLIDDLANSAEHESFRNRVLAHLDLDLESEDNSFQE